MSDLDFMPSNQAPLVRKTSSSWAEDLANEISNYYELGLSDMQARQLARLIKRRVRDELCK